MKSVGLEMDREYIRAEEDALIDFQFAVLDELGRQKMTQADLAIALNVSRARVSQLLSSEANPTIKLMGKVLLVLGLYANYQNLSELRAAGDAPLGASKNQPKEVANARKTRSVGLIESEWNLESVSAANDSYAPSSLQGQLEAA